MNKININLTKIFLILTFAFVIVFSQYIYEFSLKGAVEELYMALRNGENLFSPESYYFIFNSAWFIPLFIFWVFMSLSVFFVYVSFDEIYAYLKNYLKYEFTYVKPKGHAKHTTGHKISKRLLLHLFVIVFYLASIVAAIFMVNPLSRDMVVLTREMFFRQGLNNFQLFLAYLPSTLVWFFYLMIILFLFELFRDREMEEKIIKEHGLEKLKVKSATAKAKG